MSLFKCKMCGGDLELAEGVTIAECEYCGTKQTVPTARDENMQALFNRANTLRIKSEFDKAEKLYEKIIQADPTQTEAYWGLILCKYGIEYVDDPATFKKVPTCHRASFESIVADDDYKSALKYADMSQRAIYEEQAKEIDRIQKDILALAQKEETYDVFICYKETDANGQRTQDSVIANDIYYQLTNEGFKVFYSAITLEGKLGSAYEPIIFAALNSAKVMLAIGTKPEHFNAVWVKNEWSRYLKITKKDRTKLLIPCYRDMDAYELPDEFAHLQAQDMAKIGFINDIVRGIKKVLKKDEPKVAPTKVSTVKETVVASGNIAPLLKRTFMFLEDGEFDRADALCEQVLNQDPENAQAYVAKLMAELNVQKQEDLMNCEKPFDDKYNYQKAIRFGDEALKSTLTGYIEYISTRNENTRIDGIYVQAVSILESAKTIQPLKKAATLFNSIAPYKDATKLEKKCYENIKLLEEKAESDRKDSLYVQAKSEMLLLNIESYESAIRWFQSLNGWRDSEEQIVICQQKLEKLKAHQEAVQMEREWQAELVRVEKERRKKRNKLIVTIAIAIICAAIAFTIIFITVILPASKYDKAIALVNAGRYIEAYEALIALEGYKDSTELATSIYENYKIEKLKSAKVGDHVFWGSYEQDDNINNGKEEIMWIVLAVKDNKAFVISYNSLDQQTYHTTSEDVTWETCSLRDWLNSTFLNSAFSTDEQAAILTSTVSADRNPVYTTNSGTDTKDKIFLLSTNEAQTYFSSDLDRYCEPTKYAYENKSLLTDWWLRTPGRRQNTVTDVSRLGDIDYDGSLAANNYKCVRPAMWIDLSKVK